MSQCLEEAPLDTDTAATAIKINPGDLVKCACSGKTLMETEPQYHKLLGRAKTWFVQQILGLYISVLLQQLLCCFPCFSLSL